MSFRRVSRGLDADAASKPEIKEVMYGYFD